MVRNLSAAFMLAAVSASASPAIPSFEFSVAHIQASVAAMRAEQIKAKSGHIGQRIDELAWNLERGERDAWRLRNDLSHLMVRVSRQDSGRPGWPPHNPGRPGQPNWPGQPGPDRPDMDPFLRRDVRRFARELSETTRAAHWRLNELRVLSAEAQRDGALVAPASRLLDAARRFRHGTNALVKDAQQEYFNLLIGGFADEAVAVKRDALDAGERAQDLELEAVRLLSKVRG